MYVLGSYLEQQTKEAITYLMFIFVHHISVYEKCNIFLEKVLTLVVVVGIYITND